MLNSVKSSSNFLSVFEFEFRSSAIFLWLLEIDSIIGQRIEWHANGQKWRLGYYKDDKQDGKWTIWYQNGQVEAEATFKDGKCVSGGCS